MSTPPAASVLSARRRRSSFTASPRVPSASATGAGSSSSLNLPSASSSGPVLGSSSSGLAIVPPSPQQLPQLAYSPHPSSAHATIFAPVTPTMASTPIPGPAVGRASSSGAAAAAVAASPITTGAGAQTVAPIPPPAPYVVPDAFAPVEPGIYRSSIPGAPHVPFLRSLPVRTLVVLTPDLPSRQVAAWIEDAGIDLVHLGHQRALKPGTGGGLLSHATSSGSPSTAASASSAVQLLSQWRPCPEDLVKDALEIAMDPRRQPVLLACTTGLHETGCVVGCLRRMQHWNFTSIQAEYRAFADTKSRNAAEQMVELWDTDLVRVPDGCSVVGVVAL